MASNFKYERENIGMGREGGALTRRSVLKATSVVGFTGTAIGAVSAGSDDSGNAGTGSASGSLTLSANSAMLSNEFGQYVSRVVRDNPPEQARRLLPPGVPVPEQVDKVSFDTDSSADSLSNSSPSERNFTR
jgi:hypothetical protein